MSTKPTLEKTVVDTEEDLDDLDDVLDEFTAKPVAPATVAPQNIGGRPRTNTRVDALPSSTPGVGPPLDSTAELDEDVLSSEFAKELAKGMESLMREIGVEAGAPPPAPATDGAPVDDERARAFKAAWEAMLVDEMNGKEGAEDPLLTFGEVLNKGQASTSATTGASGSQENFQDKIKQAMDRMKEVEGKAKAAEGGSGGAGATPENMEDLLKTLGDLGLGDLGLDGTGDDTELAGFLESMMGQLMNKDVLYDPLKELADGFPGYLAKPPSPLSTEDRERYEKQLVCVKRIVAVFDDPSYSDENAESSKLVVDLMSEMQSYGSPPPEIMGPLPPGFDGNGFPGLNPNDENCTIA